MAREKFFQHAASEWMLGGGPESDIIVSSRVRLARNLRDYPFPVLNVDSQAIEIRDKVRSSLADPDWHTLDKHFEMLNMEDLTSLEKRVLVEKHLISPALAKDSRYGGVILSDNESISVMVNEEDHLRIQCLYPGLQLHDALKLANQVDNLLENHLPYAFDEKYGYMTSCPTNVGTGIRGSVMIHLPALAMTQQIGRVLSAISQVGLVARGIYGEGSEALGNLFQISNQITLGLSEEEIIDNIERVVRQIIAQEEMARRQLMEQWGVQLEDRIYRSLGILSQARVIDSKEAAQRLSDVKLGVDLGMVPGVSPHIMTELMVLTQPGFLNYLAGRELKPHERDQMRATFIRKKLGS